MVTKSRTYQRGETVPIWIESQDWEDNYENPTSGITLLHITDRNGVVKAGYLGVEVSTSFTAGLVVTGATSGATGRVKSKPPDGETLELQQITGVWQSGEVIKDTGDGESKTTAVIAAIPMSVGVDEEGKYVYYYHSRKTNDMAGWHSYQGKSEDGSGEGNVRHTVVDGGFYLE